MQQPRKVVFSRPSENPEFVAENSDKPVAEVYPQVAKPTRLGISIDKREHWLIRKRAVAMEMTINDYCRMKLLTPDER